MIPPKVFGAALRRVRGDRGFSQLDAAKAAGLALTVLNRAETGKSLLSMKSLFALLEGVGADLHDLARAIDAVGGRAGDELLGRPNATWVALLSGRFVDEARLFGLAFGLVHDGDAQARADFVASFEAVAREAARRALADVVAPQPDS